MSMDRFFGTTAAVAMVAFVSVALPSCGEDPVNAANYDAITIGMTMVQVEGIMGKAGEKQEVSGTSISGAGMAGNSRSTQDIYVWKSGLNEISVTMKDGKVVSKSKSGF
jgi:hypothetical protein